jgi:hypothetical protein
MVFVAKTFRVRFGARLILIIFKLPCWWSQPRNLRLSSRVPKTHINSLRPFVGLVVVPACCVGILLSHTLLAGNRGTRYHIDNTDFVIVGHQSVECKACINHNHISCLKFGAYIFLLWRRLSTKPHVNTFRLHSGVRHRLLIAQLYLTHGEYIIVSLCSTAKKCSVKNFRVDCGVKHKSGG